MKAQVTKLSDNHFVLPKTAGMYVDVHAFLSEDIFQATEDSVWTQIYQQSCMPGVIGAYLMPDCHTGYGTPIGSVVVTEDTILQSCNGYDISCGVVVLKVDGLFASDVADVEVRRKFIQ